MEKINQERNSFPVKNGKSILSKMMKKYFKNILKKIIYFKKKLKTKITKNKMINFDK